MAKDLKLPPSAAALSASMRDIGYSFETAIADIIDNSISASATVVSIYYDVLNDSPALAIIDNGSGMNEEELIAAMRHGATNRNQERDSNDLGRFGLGLKTASFSQCRKLTVASTQNNTLTAAEWDLDRIDREDEWILSQLGKESIRNLPFIENLDASGTIVIWRNLDRLLENEVGDSAAKILDEKRGIVENHLALVFHRFLSGDVKGRKKLSIFLNGHEIRPFDPFLTHSGTELLPEEKVRIDGTDVHIQPYILPHHSRLSAKDHDLYRSRSDFLSNQGAYIYRNGRLMAWGDWFRLIPKGEATKLARVQIDFTNNLDHQWTIDIKKSRAQPPKAVRERLSQIINKVSFRSKRVYTGRAEKLQEEIKEPLWSRHPDHTGIRYALNQAHPLFEMLREKLGDANKKALDFVLESIETSLPVEAIYSDYSSSPQEVKQTDLVKANDEISEKLHDLKKRFQDSDMTIDAKTFRDIIDSTRMFKLHKEAVEIFIDKEF